MLSDELRLLLKVHYKIVELSNRHYEQKATLDETRIETIKQILAFTERMFPNLIVMVYGPTSKRIYFSENVKYLMGYTLAGLANMSDEDILSGIHPEDLCPLRKCMERIL